MKKTKRSKCLLISGVLALAYIIYLITYFANGMSEVSSSPEAVGSGLAMTIVAPHAICVLVGVVFNFLGYFMNKPGFALTSGILYAVSMALFPLYALFIIIQMILAFVGYSNTKKIINKSIQE